MERRDFLKAGALAGGAAGLGAVGCGAVMEGMSAVPVPSIAELEALDMGSFLKRLDTSLGFIQSSASTGSLVTSDMHAAARADPRFERADETVRKTLRTLLLASSFGDLPEAGRAHPGMQSRMWSSLQEMDEATLGMNRMLGSLTPTERADIGRLLREDATSSARILGALDDEAVKAGVTDKRRTHLQDVGRHACFRLRQSTGLFIDEHAEKVKKVAARDGSFESVQRRVMAQMGEQAFWDYQARQTALARAWQSVPGITQGGAQPAVPASSYGQGPAATATVVSPYAPPGGPFPPPGGPFPPPSGYPVQAPHTILDPDRDEQGRSLAKLRKGNIILGVGGGLLGLGAIAAGASIALVSSTETQVGGYFMITAAALLGLGGIACLIAGAVIRSRA